MAAVIVITTLTVLVCAARFYSRLFVSKIIGVEDWFALLAFAFTMGTTGVFIGILAGGGYGPHTWDVTTAVFTTAYFNRAAATEVLYPTAAWLVKISIFLLYFRIFKISATGRWFIIGGIVVTTLFWLIEFTIVAVWCEPLPSQTSEQKLMSFDCAHRTPDVITALGAFNLIADVYLLSIVMPLIWRLQMSTERRIGVSLVILTGLFATICSALRIWQSSVSLKTTDPTWDEVIELVVTVYEINVGLICACLPCLPVLFRSKHMASWFSVRTWLSSRLFTRSRTSDNYNTSKGPSGSTEHMGSNPSGFHRVGSNTESIGLEMDAYKVENNSTISPV